MIGEIGQFVVRLIAKPRSFSSGALYALVTVSERLLSAVYSGALEATGNLSGQLKRRIEAKTRMEEADAARKTAEATLAANDAITKRLLAEADIEERRLKNEKLRVEIGAQRMEEQLLLIERADRKLNEALDRFRLEGGYIIVDESKLRQLIDDSSE